MKVFVIERKRFTVAAYIEENESGDQSIVALEELKRLGVKYAGSAKGLVSLLKIYSENGKGRPYGVTEEQLHHAHYDPDIFEFIKGDVRVFCFLDGNVAILTNAGLKKGQKANPRDVAKALKVRSGYFSAKAAGQLDIKERNDEH